MIKYEILKTSSLGSVLDTYNIDILFAVMSQWECEMFHSKTFRTVSESYSTINLTDLSLLIIKSEISFV